MSAFCSVCPKVSRISAFASTSSLLYHYHWVLETPAGNLSRFMQSLCTAYTVYFNNKSFSHPIRWPNAAGGSSTVGDEDGRSDQCANGPPCWADRTGWPAGPKGSRDGASIGRETGGSRCGGEESRRWKTGPLIIISRADPTGLPMRYHPASTLRTMAKHLAVCVPKINDIHLRTAIQEVLSHTLESLLNN